ncbi:hypothetical protein EMIHUDRAFT_452299, partial [Emiliania huxleyi CCMP1516]|uniref:TFIID subunit TAF5 NTD2 domain-containing protein n=2 Tax=Emiliania huxleyi TaxID=2903 RepID=A0A0D3IKL2_EMIH1
MGPGGSRGVPVLVPGVEVQLLLFESFGGFGKGVREILRRAADVLQNKLTRAQYLDEVTWTTKSWLGLQKQRISVVLHTAIAEQAAPVVYLCSCQCAPVPCPALSSDGGMHSRKGLRLGLHLHPEQEGPGYVESFRRWSEWLDGSSASLQRELGVLRFPILLHCFIGIACRLGDMAPARRFLQEHAPKLRDEAQRAAASTLEKLQHAAQLQEHEGARRYLVHRTTVFCSPEARESAWEALVAFLTASQLPLLLRVLTRHFDVFAVASVCGRADGALQFCRFSQSAATQSRFAASGVDLESRCRVVPGHSGPVYSVALSRNLQHVLSGSQDGSVRLWSWHQAAVLATYHNHGYPVWHVCLASHQSHFLSCCHDGGLRLFDTQRLSPLRLMAGHLADVTAATFHASDAYALSASQDCSPR